MSTATLHSEKKKMLIPQLRFPGFEGEWKETLLNDVAEFRKGKGISKSDIIDDGNLECIRYGELYTTYNELIVNIVSKTNLPVKGLELSEFNDVIIPASGETQLDIATASCVLKSGVALSGDLNIIRSSLNGIFLSFYLNNKKKLEIAKLAQGSSVVHLYSSQLKSLKLNIPSQPEQQKIASFLSAVDEKIQQLSRKKELLEQYKKGVMQQLFSGKLRFKDENGKDYPDWEEKKLGEVCEIVGGGTPDTNIPEYWGGEIQWFTPTEIKSDFVSNSIRTITELGLQKSSAKKLPIGTILLTTRATIGEVSIAGRECTTNQGFQSLITSKENCSIFIFNWIKRNKHELISRANGSTFPEISKNAIEKISLNAPSLPEQQKIANFLSSIDTKIENVNGEIGKTQLFKKGLLQQMFV